MAHSVHPSAGGLSVVPFAALFVAHQLAGAGRSPAAFFAPTAGTALFLAAFVAFQVVLLLRLPGPISPTGYTPPYKQNGFPAFIITVLLFVALPYALGYSPALYYDHCGDFAVQLCVVALLLCVFLYWKGLRHPSSKDSGRMHNIAFDFYYGMETYPSIGGVSLKQLVVCRIGMMLWTLFAISSWFKQFEMLGHRPSNSITASLLVTMTYLAKVSAPFNVHC